MQSQETFYFGRTMEPCDYKAKLAKTLEDKDCVVVTAYDGGKKKQKDKTLDEK